MRLFQRLWLLLPCLCIASSVVRAQAPAIITPPANQTVALGGTATFAVSATGGRPLSYQWLHNGLAVAGGTTATLTIGSAQLADAGTYAVTVWNSTGSIVSTAAQLAGTGPAPTITIQPKDLTATAGQSATLNVSAVGTGTLLYQWRRNGWPLPGATNPSFTITNATRSDADYYDVLVGSGLSVAFSNRARLQVAPSTYALSVAPDSAHRNIFETDRGTGIYSIVPSPDGGVYLGGFFQSINSNRRSKVARCTAGGALDPSFVGPELRDYDVVVALAVQADGKVIVGGAFGSVTAVSSNLMRLNPDGTLDPSFQSRGFDGIVSALALQSDGKILIAGEFANYYNIDSRGMPRTNIARLNTDGTLDSSFTASPNAMVTSLAVQTDGRVVIGGYFSSVGGQARNYIARLQPNGSLDASFGSESPNYGVTSLVLAGTGKVVAAGYFTSVGGLPVGRIARWNSDGTLDSTFTTANGFDDSVASLCLQSDGKLIAGGQFTRCRGTGRARIARFNADGTLDDFFNPGADDKVTALAAQPDGRIFVGGNFAHVGGIDRNHVARLNADGALDGTFVVAPRIAGVVSAAISMPGGKVLVGGEFTHINGVAITGRNLARFHADGSLDSTFGAGAGPVFSVNALLLQPDGRVVVGGGFLRVAVPAPYLARITADGALDPTFPAGGIGPNYVVSSLAAAPGGQIIVAGGFDSYNGVSRNHVARLHADGAVDPTFRPAAVDANVRRIAVTSAGKVYIGGYFGTVGGETRQAIARLSPDGSLDPTFADSGLLYSAESIVIQADEKVVVGGFSAGIPYQNITRFNVDGTTDSSFGVSNNMTTGPVSAVVLQEDGRVVVAGMFPSIAYMPNTGYVGRFNADGTRDTTFSSLFTMGFEELLLRDNGQFFVGGQSGDCGVFTAPAAAPLIVAPPVSQTATVGSTVTFSVSAAGNPSPTYQWALNGLAVAGATNATLTLANVQPAQAGSYTVTITNEIGTITSGVATLGGVETPPAIVTQPQPALAVAGQPVSLRVGATGIGPITYQWRRNGSAVAGATGTTFTIAAASRSDADWYDVVTSVGLSLTTSNRVRLDVAPASYAQSVAPDGTHRTLFESDGVWVSALLPLADGRIVVGGNFRSVNSVSRSRIAVFNSDGTLDARWNGPDLGTARYPAVYAVAVQADGKMIVGGEFTQVTGVQRSNLIRLNPDGSIDASFATRGVDREVRAIAVQSDGKILVGGAFMWVYDRNYVATSRQGLIRLNADGTLDLTYAPEPNGSITAIVVQPDARVVIGGSFTTIAAQPRSYLARLNVNGRLDAWPGSSGPNQPVEALALQPDGKLLVGGDFTAVNGTPAGHIVRLDTAGSIDAEFMVGAGFDREVVGLALQPDGKVVAVGDFQGGVVRLNGDGTRDTGFTMRIDGWGRTVACAGGQILLGGYFSQINGTSCNRFARLNNDGSLDRGFVPAIRTVGLVNASILLPGGKLLVGGDFTHVNGVAVAGRNLACFKSDGSIDPTFNAGSGPDSTVNALLLQPDGRIVVGGYFFHFNGRACPCLARITATGAYDDCFPLGGGGPNSAVRALAASPGGQIIVAGFFSTYGNAPRAGVARVQADGSLDASFVPPESDSHVSIDGVAVAPDAKLYIAGLFTMLAGKPHDGFARLNNNGAVDETFAYAGPRSPIAVAPQRDGKVMVAAYQSDGAFRWLGRFNTEGSRDYSFDLSANIPDDAVLAITVQEDGRILVGGAFSSIGGAGNTAHLARFNPNGSRDSNFSVVGITDTVRNFVLRDNGQMFLGSDSGDNGVFTAPATTPTIVLAPISQAAVAGGTASFAVAASGNPPPTYQWALNGVPVSGATNATLTLTNVQLVDAGSYTVTVTNAAGSITSSPALLVLAPTIGSQFASRSVGLGGRTTFSLLVKGTAPLRYQWRKNGIAMAGATNAALMIDPVATVDAGSYSLQVSNSAGNVTSAPALLTVLPNPLGYSARQFVRAEGLTGFFTIEGGEAKQVLLRALGPALATLGVAGGISDPQITLLDVAGHVLAANDNWGTVAGVDWGALLSRVGATPLPVGSCDAALPITLLPGAYSVRVTGVNGATGQVLLEMYDLDQNPNSRLAYVGLRGRTDGAGAMTAALAMTNSANKRLLIRAIGPTLGTSTAMANPWLQVLDGSVTVASNDDWAGTTALVAAVNQAGAFALPGASTDAALLVDSRIGTGSYVVQVPLASGVGDVLLEFYDLAGDAVASYPPIVVAPPVDRTVVTGDTATLRVLAVGGPPLLYQWRKGGVQLSGETTAALVLGNVSSAVAGNYDVVVSRGTNTVTSAPATITVVDRVLKILSQTGTAASTVVVPVQLIAHGDEHALSFSVNFDPAKLTFVSASPGAQAAGATLSTNSSLAIAGNVGIAITKPSAGVWAAGAQEVVDLTFSLGSTAADGNVVPITFGDAPVSRQVSSAVGAVLPTSYEEGSITVLNGYEADMNGNGVVTVTDWVKIGRIVAGLEPAPTGVDLQKADCAPRSSLGNGALSVTDWVQAGRYAAGLDPLTPVGGPTGL